MRSPSMDLTSALEAIVREYRSGLNPTELDERLLELGASATADALVVACEPYRDEPAIIAPLYGLVVEAQPGNARAIVILANAWWLQGRGPEAVGELASRAIAADPANRGAWHLWALSESNARERVARWRQVTNRFPTDELAIVNVADNASAVAGAEQDYAMLDLAVQSYEHLLARATEPAQRGALETVLNALKGWKF